MSDITPKYNLIFQKVFTKTFTKNFKNDKILIQSLEKTLTILRFDPFYPSIKTHKVRYP
jgi:mRNA-degrading endonuclease YafQ of YafQ-DinJ toxin-antitoxin module